jgi:DDB1- and CUL4-associated factor 6
MPHSNDQTLVTCAGDSEVRIFDIEYAGHSTSTSQQSETASSIRSQRYNNYFPGLRYLNEGTTNAKVFRSHADRVKRIVTESSPYLFLSCSEDGEVRQWDLRQPSSTYPAPLGGRGFMSYRTAREHDSSNVPPPLISYKKYHLDLNSISCSASQPHYIALGGAHLHCFLHDRRMLGRDLGDERGQADSPAPAAGSHDDELMGQATRCVRRFAPNGQKRMKRTDNGHITACKISDANPNEMVVSWSGEHVYSFDLVQSPDAREAEEREVSSRTSRSTGRVKKDLKRKRDKATSTTSLASVRPRSRLRQDDDPSGDEITLRVRYGNGQSEDIPVEPSSHQADVPPTSLVERARQDVLTEAQKLSHRLAEGLVKLRKMLFSLEASSRQASQTISSLDLTPHTRSLTSVLGYAATYLPLMDEVMRDWRYPVNPSTQEIAFHQTMRKNRASTRRFMQASGTLAKALGGKLRTAGSGESPHLQLFREIVPAPNEGSSIDTESQFSYDFLKAILLWLEGGPQALVQGFKRPPDQRHDSPRFPLLDDATQDAIDDTLIPYLLRLASARPIINIDASRFETDANRVVFESEATAVVTFGNAIKIPLEDLSRAIMPAATVEDEADAGPAAPAALLATDRRAAARFWGFKVGRALLMKAGEGVNFAFVNRAFGGISITVPDNDDHEFLSAMIGNDSGGRSQEDIDPNDFLTAMTENDFGERSQEDIDPNEADEIVESVRVVSRRPITGSSTPTQANRAPEVRVASASVDTNITGMESSLDDIYDVDSDTEEESDDDDDSISDPEERLFMRRPAFDRSKMREGVERHTPCSSHTNVYRGHCNVKTVKDVNYFGLQDDYVVSGSDSGHLFIWDKKSSQLLNILEGDGEVVNVVQGK